MLENSSAPLSRRVKNIVIGKSLNLGDQSIFHHLSLIAFFAWVGLGADGLSSSCYGPAEAFLALGDHAGLSLFTALATAGTIFVISAAYSQIIDLFPAGGGGYVVASKLLSPKFGMVSGCALLIDYVLTISVSVASGADAVFSFLPASWLPWKTTAAIAGVVFLILLNLRGVKESVLVLAPIFLLFVLTHLAALGYGLGSHAAGFPATAARIGADIGASRAQLGTLGMALLILRAYGVGAGAFTGIEAVSNGLPILREPRGKTGKRAMLYMAVSLSLAVTGLTLCYLLFQVRLQPGKTLNAALFEAITASWGPFWGGGFTRLTLASEALLLLIAAQAGFVDGPRVLSNMALDRWLPARFALLSDRLVARNGVLLMGGAGLVLILATGGSVDMLIVFYSINVFITFVLSQLGMARHWWSVRGREARWRKGLFINGLGLALTASILCMVTAVKFHEGGWITLVITGALAGLALCVNRHYRRTGAMIKALDALCETLDAGPDEPAPDGVSPLPARPDPDAPTAVFFVNGYNGLGIHTLLGVMRLFGREMKNLVFVQIGMVDAGVFKGADELARLKASMEQELGKYETAMRRRGYYAESHWAVGTDVVREVMELAPVIAERFPRAIFFGGQLVFARDNFITRLLHNSIVFSLQRRFYHLGLPFMIMPIVLEPAGEEDREIPEASGS